MIKSSQGMIVLFRFPHPVNLLGDRTDRIFDNLYYRDMSAQWGGINIYPSSTGNLFQYAEIRGMTTGIVVRQDSTDTHFLAEAPEGIVGRFPGFAALRRT